jgi:predicted transcriptional regulator
LAERRSRIQVIVDILRVLESQRGRSKPTHILYKSNLSHKLLKEHLNTLIQRRLVEVELDGGRTYYRITDSGREFVAEFRKIERLSEAFGLPV